MNYLNIIFFLSSFFIVGNVSAQLKENNFLIIDTLIKDLKVSRITSEGNRFLNLNKTGFKYENDLTFVYYNKGPVYCCNYYEVKSIPKEWNIITVKDIVAHMEDKTTGFRFNEKKLFFIEYDKERKIYKAYQVDIIGWPRED